MPARKEGREEQLPRVLVEDAEYGPGLQRVVQNILQAFPRDWRGKTVLVKPNMLAPHSPDKAVTTHPELVRQVVLALRDQGAQVMVGDNPGVGGYGRSQRSADVSGIEQASGGCYLPLARYPLTLALPGAGLGQVTISRQVLEADVVVNMPKLKTHALTVLTAGIKNTFGYVVGGDKMRIHAACPGQKQFARALVDIMALRPPELTILDAVLGMEGNGPANGRPVHLGKILASDNVVSLDAVAAVMLGLRAQDVPHILEGGKQGVGEIRVDRILIQGGVQPVQNFAFPQTFIPGMAGFLLNRCLSRWINCLPQVVSERCRHCGICVSHCPVGAMRMTDQGPELDRSKCIHCYCCQEMCPEDAIRLNGRVLSWIRGRRG